MKLGWEGQGSSWVGKQKAVGDPYLVAVVGLWPCMPAQCSVVSDSFATLWTMAHHGILCPWDFAGKNTGTGCHSLLQGIFQTQGSNQRHLHCRRILYLLSHWGSPWALWGGNKFKGVQGTTGNWVSTRSESWSQILPTLQDCMLLTVSENISTLTANWFRFAGTSGADGVGVTWLMLMPELFLGWNRTCGFAKSSSTVDLQANVRQHRTLRVLPTRTETSGRHHLLPHTSHHLSLGWMVEPGNLFLGGEDYFL